MLIDKGFKSGDTVSIKLISGEELISRFESENNDDFVISKPMAITLGGQGLGLVPWIFLGEKETITLKKLHIIAALPSKKEAADQYLQGTTGIALR